MGNELTPDSEQTYTEAQVNALCRRREIALLEAIEADALEMFRPGKPKPDGLSYDCCLSEAFEQHLTALRGSEVE